MKTAVPSKTITTQTPCALGYAFAYLALQKTFHQTETQSRIKHGDAQHACIAQYINLLEASSVQASHSPFAEPAWKNEKLITFFQETSTGQTAEEALRFRTEGNWYEVSR